MAIHSRAAHRALRALWVAVAAALLGSSGGALASPPKPGGAPLVAAIETTPLVVLGTIDGVTRLDAHGYAADLTVERALRGEVEPGSELTIAWEELAKGRETRLANADRIVVALEPLPTQSLWRTRFPNASDDGSGNDNDRVFVIATRGTAFQPGPDPTTTALLTRLAALAPDAWNGSTGVTLLAETAAHAQPRIATGALARLQRVENLSSVFEAAARAEFAALLASNEAPERLKREAIQLIGDADLSELRDPLAGVAAAPGPLEADAWTALAKLDPGLSAQDVAALLGREEGVLRAVAVEQAKATPSEKRVPLLIVEDPAPEVRSAAVEAWVAWNGAAGVPQAEPALFDVDRQVRGHAARAIGGVGEEVVPRLLELLEGRSVEDSLGPVAALSLAGPKGYTALKHLESSHPDEKVRKLIRFALGQRIDPH